MTPNAASREVPVLAIIGPMRLARSFGPLRRFILAHHKLLIP
jgi:hypothetical protein